MSAKSPIISIIIPVYNSEKYLQDTLDSVLKQSFSDFEVICIDDGSTDKSNELLTKYESKDRRIHIITQKNQGVVCSKNNAVKHVRGEFICFLDSDDVIEEKFLEKSYNAIIAGQGDIVSCRVMLFGCENGEMYLHKPTKLNMSRGNCLVNTALLKKTLFDKSGGFDEAFSKGLEDYDLWLNMIYRQNAIFYRIPEFLFFYRIKPTDESRNATCAKTHSTALFNLLHKKYPQIVTYQKLYKFASFIFQIRHKPKKNKTIIRLLTLPIFSIRQTKMNKTSYYMFDLFPIWTQRVQQYKIDEIKKVKRMCKELNERSIV